MCAVYVCSVTSDHRLTSYLCTDKKMPEQLGGESDRQQKEDHCDLQSLRRTRPARIKKTNFFWQKPRLVTKISSISPCIVNHIH